MSNLGHLIMPVQVQASILGYFMCFMFLYINNDTPMNSRPKFYLQPEISPRGTKPHSLIHMGFYPKPKTYFQIYTFLCINLDVGHLDMLWRLFGYVYIDMKHNIGVKIPINPYICICRAPTRVLRYFYIYLPRYYRFASIFM